MAHTYFSHQHNAVVHHENGKDHVHYQIGKAAKEDAPEQKNTTPKTDDDNVVIPLSDYSFSCCKKLHTHQVNDQLDHLPIVYLALQGPPPRLHPTLSFS